MRKMKYVFEQVVVMDGTRKMSTQTINKTAKVSSTCVFSNYNIQPAPTCTTVVYSV